jgi:parvulin-like peptidyl-prolyl isomerase
MKKLLIFVFILLCFNIFSIPIDPTIARIKLTTTEVITQRQFQEKIEILENSYQTSTTVEERLQILDGLIDEILVVQAAERDGVIVSTSEINQSVEQYQTELAMQFGMNRPLTEDELKSVIVQQGSSWDEFIEQIEKKVIIEKYIQQKKGSYFESLEEPSNSEIEDFYESNKMEFISPDIVKFKQILIFTKDFDSTIAGLAEDKANQIYREIQAGSSFDRYLEVFLDDTNSTKVGGLSFDIWLRDDDNTKTYYGNSFFTEVFRMDEGERSGLMESNIGYHIVEIIEKIPLAVLGLDDDVPPQNTFTVREYIINLIMNSNAQELFESVTVELIEEVRAQSEVEIFEQYLTW